ncbi:hypothetical protein V6N13_059006 [Hibiscus sabdariffa]
MRIPKKPVAFCLSIFSPDFPAPCSSRILRFSSGFPAKIQPIYAAGYWLISSLLLSSYYFQFVRVVAFIPLVLLGAYVGRFLGLELNVVRFWSFDLTSEGLIIRALTILRTIVLGPC